MAIGLEHNVCISVGPGRYPCVLLLSKLALHFCQIQIYALLQPFQILAECLDLLVHPFFCKYNVPCSTSLWKLLLHYGKKMQEKHYQTHLQYVHTKYFLETSKWKAITLCEPSNYNKEPTWMLCNSTRCAIDKVFCSSFECQTHPSPHKMHNFIPDWHMQFPWLQVCCTHFYCA